MQFIITTMAATAQDRELERIKVFRKWAFTINVELLTDERLRDKSFMVEGGDLTNKVDKRNKTLRTTIWIGPMESREADKKHAYEHRHCAVECTAGGISKMTAVNYLAKYLNINPALLTCGHGQVITYSQPVQKWPEYKLYMFKSLPGRLTSESEHIQQSVIHLRRKLKRNPTEREVLQYLVGDNKLLSFQKAATTTIRQQVKLAIDLADQYKSSDSDEDENEDGRHFLSDLVKLDVGDNMEEKSVSFFETILPNLVKQLKSTTKGFYGNPDLKHVLEIIGMMIIPLFMRRNHNDHKTKCLVFYGASRTGKSFMFMQLVKAGKLHQIASDANGVGRFEAPISCTGFFFDDCKEFLLKSKDEPTIKNLTRGDEASVKIFGGNAPIRGWVVITCQQRLDRYPVDAAAWSSRLLEVNFSECEPYSDFVTAFDIMKKSNIEEMLTFLYFIVHKPVEFMSNTNIANVFFDTSYYDNIVCSMFDRLTYGNNLLRLLNHKIVQFEKEYQ